MRSTREKGEENKKLEERKGNSTLLKSRKERKGEERKGEERRGKVEERLRKGYKRQYLEMPLAWILILSGCEWISHFLYFSL